MPAYGQILKLGHTKKAKVYGESTCQEQIQLFHYRLLIIFPC